MQKDLIQFGETHKVQGMTSLQIAEVTGKRHADVMRDIRNILGQGVNERNFALVEYRDKKGESRPMYEPTPKGCLILASGYDVVLREKIIDKLEEIHDNNRSVSKSLLQSVKKWGLHRDSNGVLRSPNNYPKDWSIKKLRDSLNELNKEIYI